MGHARPVRLLMLQALRERRDTDTCYSVHALKSGRAEIHAFTVCTEGWRACMSAAMTGVLSYSTGLRSVSRSSASADSNCAAHGSALPPRCCPAPVHVTSFPKFYCYCYLGFRVNLKPQILGKI